jgi:hypothetical protein
MNFLSFGFTPTAVGNSDSHNWVTVPPGIPRSMVRVPDDGASGIGRGLEPDVVATLKGTMPRDVVVTNGPMLGLTVDGAGIGALDAHPGAMLQVAIRVQTAAWDPVDEVELYANDTFATPQKGATAFEPLAPAICFSARATPSARCASAIGGARPLSFDTIAVAAGASRLEANLAFAVAPQDLLAHAPQRAGARGQDLWLVALAHGSAGLFPTIPSRVSAAEAAMIIDGGSTQGIGVPAYAFTNPVFVDVDGGGWKAPFQN